MSVRHIQERAMSGSRRSRKGLFSSDWILLIIEHGEASILMDFRLVVKSNFSFMDVERVYVKKDRKELLGLLKR